jgi:peptidoglycan/xylan/chitin deacetylase (PgdA/CDA1 family)
VADFRWPDKFRCAVALTFDMDGETVPYVLDPSNAPRRMALMSEYSYGPRVAMPHILELLDLYEIHASFFVPGRTIELHGDLVKTFVSRGHDLGYHGYMHERPDMVDDQLEEKILLRSIEVVKATIGTSATGYRSPAWELKPSSPELLVRNGIKYDSSLMGEDIPYWIKTPAGDLLELPVHWRNDDWPQFGFVSVPSIGHGISAPSKALEIFTEEFEGLYARGGIFVMTMHPFLAGRPSGLRLLESLVRFIRGFPRVWWAPLSAIAEYCSTPAVAGTLPVHTTDIPQARWLE